MCPQPALRRWARLRADGAPTGTAEEFLAFCGVPGLGRSLVEDDRHALEELRRHAADPRWRLREAVAMALQRWGEVDFEALAAAMAGWARGSPLKRRAAAAALCEPALLTTRERVGEVVSVLTEATTVIAHAGAEGATVGGVQGAAEGARLLLERGRGRGAGGGEAGVRTAGGAGPGE
ncbi:MAG TPA: hypothetical protein VFR38_16275 [Gaiellaceae bacterium]|nr:hypothetical protein [Gaiellaceae bacterium]